MQPGETRMRGRPRSFHDSSKATHIKSLERALSVLKTVAEADGLTLSEVAQRSDQPAATAYRALLTMQAAGLIEFDEARQLWRIGVESFRIGSAFLRGTNVVEKARGMMQELTAQTGETANLAILDGMDVVFISQVETHEPIRAFFRPGTKGAAHASGIGKALLAYQPPVRVAELLKTGKLTAFTDNSLTDADSLNQDLTRTRERGWAVDDEERNLGMRCIAAPIFNAHGEAIAGISVSGPSVRMQPALDAQLGASVRAAADRITESIGGSAP